MKFKEPKVGGWYSYEGRLRRVLAIREPWVWLDGAGAGGRPETIRISILNLCLFEKGDVVKHQNGPLLEVVATYNEWAWVSHKHGNNNPLLRPMCYHFSELALA